MMQLMPHRLKTLRSRLPELFLMIILAVPLLVAVDRPGVYGQDREQTGTQPSPDASIEQLTQEYLSQIKSGLDARIAANDQKHLWQDGKWLTEIRNGLINLGMRDEFSGLTAWVLQEVGDKAWVRRTFFFAMPFFEWMCEPFVYPVDSALPEQQYEGEMNRLVEFVTLKKQKGMAVSLDHVGDASLSEEDAREYLDFYLRLLDRLAERETIDEINFSIKLSALVYGLDRLQNVRVLDSSTSEEARGKAEEIKEKLSRLLHAAGKVRNKRVFIRIDMEEYAYKDATLAIFRDVVVSNADVIRNGDGSLRLGVVIQAYLRDAWKDLEALLQWGGKVGVQVPVRLVKGAYEKYEKELAARSGDIRSPVWNNKESTDASYEALCEFLILNRDRFQIAIATHNIRSIAHGMGLARYYGLGKGDVEFQMLQGMGDEIKDVVVGMGYRMRVYVPAGTYARGLKYAGRRFHELASRDNALTRTLRGEYKHLEGPAPRFTGPEDIRDGAGVEALVAACRQEYPSSP